MHYTAMILMKEYESGSHDANVGESIACNLFFSCCYPSFPSPPTSSQTATPMANPHGQLWNIHDKTYNILADTNENMWKGMIFTKEGMI